MKDRSTPTIEIDMDKPCTSCGVMGALPIGKCMSCAADAILGPDVNGEKLIVQSLVSASRQIDALMALHSSEIHRAYVKSTEGKTSIGIAVEMSPSQEMPNAILVKAKINFIESRIKDESQERVSPQQNLPLDA